MYHLDTIVLIVEGPSHHPPPAHYYLYVAYCVYANRTQAKKIILILCDFLVKVVTRSIKIHYEKF